jgi:SpoVK/Ycf46/Vps4 family AAA+-type ATPase
MRIRNACFVKHHFNQPAGDCIITTSAVISSKCYGDSVLREEKVGEEDKKFNLLNISSIFLFYVLGLF